MRKIVVANWKSNKDRGDVQRWLATFTQEKIAQTVELVIAPPFPLLSLFPAVQDKIALAVQDISPYSAGSYTGAVSAENLKGMGVKYGIVGHSERRRYFHETHQDVANKVDQCLLELITPIVCVDDEYIVEQAAAIDPIRLKQCVVAYEELGAIGTGHNEPVAHVVEVVKQIKSAFGDVPVLYGGSVEPANVRQYLEVTDGVLVGGASLKTYKFAEIARTAAELSD